MASSIAFFFFFLYSLLRSSVSTSKTIAFYSKSSVVDIYSRLLLLYKVNSPASQCEPMRALTFIENGSNQSTKAVIELGCDSSMRRPGPNYKSPGIILH